MKNIIEIQNFNDKNLDVYARLNEKQLINCTEFDDGLFIAESPMVIERALDAGCEAVSVLMEKRHIDKADSLLSRCGDIPIYVSEADVLCSLTGFYLTRGMLCAMKRSKLADAEEILSKYKKIAVLENVMNPTNIGAIFRSAAALGMEAVLLTDKGSDPLYRRAIRVSMATVFQIPWAYLPDGDWTKYLHDKKYTLIAMALNDNSISLRDTDSIKADKIAVVLGSEGYGLEEDTIAKCDYTVKIPMSNGVDSLNVAAASAVAFYQFGLDK